MDNKLEKSKIPVKKRKKFKKYKIKEINDDKDKVIFKNKMDFERE